MVKVFLTAASTFKVGRHYNMGFGDLAAEVISSLESSVRSSQIDAVVVASAYPEKTGDQVMLASKVVTQMGLGDRVMGLRTEQGDASGLVALAVGYSLVRAGLANNVLLLGMEKQSEFPSRRLNDIVAQNLDEVYAHGVGLTNHAVAAILMREHMKRYGHDYEYYASWPITMHENGKQNPHAYLDFKVNLETVKSAQVVSEPLRLFDLAPRADGAAAVLLSSDEFAPKVSDSRVEVGPVCSSTIRVDYEPRLLSAANSMRYALDAVGLSMSDVDLFEVHDSYSVMASMILEETGLTPPGRGLELLQHIPINLGGGLKARGYPGGATGIYQLAEMYGHLTGTFQGRKVENVEVGLVQGMSDLGETSLATVLRVM
ncbi:thiolase family protein [Sulfodiicoccus acidiphilus]|nr:thiolase family protein [Sulfodiicoccus acidiphilus]